MINKILNKWEQCSYIHTNKQTNLYSAKIVETNQRRWRRVTRQ